jgi:hypothetical protein
MFISNAPLLREHLPTDEKYQESVDNITSMILDIVRKERNNLLAASDWTQFPNAPLSDEKKQQWADYREALRNFPSTLNIDLSQSFIIEDSSFPSKPE